MATWFAFMTFIAVCGVGIQLSVFQKKVSTQLDLIKSEMRERGAPKAQI